MQRHGSLSVQCLENFEHSQEAFEKIQGTRSMVVCHGPWLLWSLKQLYKDFPKTAVLGMQTMNQPEWWIFVFARKKAQQYLSLISFN